MKKESAPALFAAPAVAAEPGWLTTARRRNGAYVGKGDDFAPAVLDRRALLAGYDELAEANKKLAARLDTQQAEIAAVAEVLEVPEGGSVLQAVIGLIGRKVDLRSELAETREKVTSLLEDFANGCAPVQMGPGVQLTPYWRGVNNERANGLAWAKLKCEELSIDWPIKPIPYKGDLPTAPAESAPACLHNCSSCQKGKEGGVGNG